jgi:hypothetical protein
MVKHEQALRWKPSRNKIKNKDSVFFDDANVGQRVGILDGGAVVAVPHCPYEWWIDPSGNLVPVVLHTNRVYWVSRREYELDRVKQMIKEGWVCYERPADYVYRGDDWKILESSDKASARGAIAAWEAEREEIIKARVTKTAAAVPEGIRNLGKSELQKLVDLQAASGLSGPQLLDAFFKGLEARGLVAAPTAQPKMSPEEIAAAVGDIVPKGKTK